VIGHVPVHHGLQAAPLTTLWKNLASQPKKGRFVTVWPRIEGLSKAMPIIQSGFKERLLNVRA
jgi:hypothetical protein